VRIVLDDQNRLADMTFDLGRVTVFLVVRMRLPGVAGKVDFDGRAFVLLAVDLQMSARLFDEAVNLAEPEAGAGVDGLSGEERLEGAGGNTLIHGGAALGS